MGEKKITLDGLDYRRRKISKIKGIINTILANGCYSEKEMELQIKTGTMKGKLTGDELQLLERAWKYRQKLAHQLIIDANKLLDEWEKKE